MWLLAVSAHAAGWTQPAGGWFVKAGYRAVPGAGARLADGSFAETRPFVDHAAQVYAELGVTDAWTAVLTGAPLGYAVYDAQATLYTGPTLVGLRRALGTGAVRTAAELRIGGAPPVGAVDLDPTEGLYQPTVAGGLIDGELQLGTSLGDGWLSLSAGVRGHTALHPAALGMAQVGRAWDHLVLDVHVPVHWSFAVDTVNVTGAGDTQYVGLGLGLSWWFGERAGVQTGFDGGPVARANAAAPSLPLALLLRG